MKVVWLLGSQGPWQCLVHRDEGLYYHRRYGVIRGFFLASDSSALVRIECGGGTTAWFMGTLVGPSVQRH